MPRANPPVFGPQIPRPIARARAAERRAFENEARAQRMAVGAFQHEPRTGRAGGPVLRDGRLVLDIRNGRTVSADNVNRQFRRLAAETEALQQRYLPQGGLMWAPGRTRIVANRRKTSTGGADWPHRSIFTGRISS